MIKIRSDTKGFRNTMDKYTAVFNKLPEDVVNKNAKDACLKAIKLTKAATPEQIEADLNQPSKTDPRATVAMILAHKDGTLDSQKLIRKRKGHANVCRAGWKNAGDRFKAVRGSSGFTPRLRNKRSLGDAKPATTHNHTARAEAWNDYSGNGSAQVTAIQLEGLNAALATVEQDRADYTEKQLAKMAGIWR